MSVFELILGIVKAIPALLEWVDKFVTFYVNKRIDGMKQENKDAIKNAVKNQDQRDIEKALGSPKAGELSGVPGSEIRDTLPGVKP